MNSTAGTLESISVGAVKRRVMPDLVRVDFRHPFWTSGIFKSPIAGSVRISAGGIPGDEQADLENHGGPDNAVLAYDADHYPVWREELQMPDLGPGAFGENFSVTGFTDHDVCIGDIWQVAPAHAADSTGLRLQVTQARVPCYKLARRLQQPHIVKRVHETSWGGWYLRVLQEGDAAAGMTIRLVERKHPQWTVAAAVQAMYAKKKDTAQAQALLALPELSARWKRQLADE